MTVTETPPQAPATDDGPVDLLFATVGRHRATGALLAPTTGWCARPYSTLLPYTKPGEIRSIHFDFLRDESGARFPTNNTSIRIEKIELITGDERANVRFGLGY